MGFFNRMRVASRVFREELKKNKRDNICADLQALGIDAQMAERGRPEEEIGGWWDSLGLIDISEGPIHWVNVRKEVHGGVEGGDRIYYYTDYGVPDPRLGPASPEMYIYSVRKKPIPLVGKVVDLHWEGRASLFSPIGKLGARIIDRLKSDILIKNAIIWSHDVKICAHGECRCWIIETKTGSAPSEELWSCYQAIAHHLLAEWPDQEAKWYCVECGGGISESDKVCPKCGVEF